MAVSYKYIYLYTHTHTHIYIHTHTHIYIFFSSSVAHMVIDSHADWLVIPVASQEYNQFHYPDLSRESGSGVGAPEWHHPTQTCTIPQNVPSAQHATGALPLTSHPPHDKVASLEFNIPNGTTCASCCYS